MFRKQTLNKKIETVLEDIFWVSYILFMILALVTAFGAFVVGLYSTFFA